MGTRSPVGMRDSAASLQPAPKGEFVTGELAADCARFLAETRRRVERRREVEVHAAVSNARWRTAD